ncbi:MAG: TlpA disulfide reductase family protein [Bacteroidota bacterium]
MKKIQILLASLFIAFGAFSQIKVSISGSVFNATTDSVSLAQYYGPNNYKDFKKVPLDKKGNFSIETELPNPDFYVFRVGNVHVNVILRDGSALKIYSDGKDIAKFSNITGSEESARMNEFLRMAQDWAIKRENANLQTQANPSQADAINQQLTKEYQDFQNLMKEFVVENKNSAALIPTTQFIDPKNDFASYEQIVLQVYAAFSESPSVQNLYNNYLQLKKEKEAADRFGAGKEAPDFEELKVDGKTTMKLSDLRGKVVLLDFWASWCGPCRRENPNVVKTYAKYKDAGFTVMSVSLDRDKAAWLAAIKADNLSWPNHVSDLQQWSSKVAQLYGVRGIPFTMLIDAEGKIISTNLRGEQLEQALSKIYGF